MPDITKRSLKYVVLPVNNEKTWQKQTTKCSLGKAQRSQVGMLMIWKSGVKNSQQ